MIHCIMVAVLTQFPLEALYSRRYTLSGLLSYVVFELLGMMLFALSVFYWTYGVIKRVEGRIQLCVGLLTPDTEACVRQAAGFGKRAHDVGSQMIKLYLT